MFKWIAAAALSLTPAAAQAQDWRLASQGDTTGSAFFVDARSIVKTGPNARGTAFLIMRPDDGVHAIETVLEFDCGTLSKRVINMRPYDTAEKPGQLYDGSNSWEETPRDTQFAAVGEIFCGNRPLAERSFGSAPPFAAWRSLSSGN